MKRQILFIILFFSFSFFAVPSLFAAVSTGTALFYSEHNEETSTITLTNSQKKPLPLRSGLELFAGDSLQTREEPLILLIPRKTLLLEIHPFTSIRFGIKELFNDEVAIQLLVESGTLTATAHEKNELQQILSDIQFPEPVAREDRKINDTTNVGAIYVHIINKNGEVTSKNIEKKMGIFVTRGGIDEQSLVNAYKKLRSSGINTRELLIKPTYTHNPVLSLSLQMGIYLPDFGVTQHVGATFFLDILYKKFNARLRVPALFSGSNQLYRPIGENDYFGAMHLDNEEYRNEVSSADKALLRFEHLLALFLTKISSMSLGLPHDTFYIYYGDQKTIHHRSNSLLYYQYKPVPNLANNLNKDFLFNIDFSFFGNTARIRHFQAPSILSNWINKFELFSNRFWFKPFSHTYPLEIGISAALDFHTNKFNTENTALERYASAALLDSQNYFFYSADITVPLLITNHFTTNAFLEFGQLIPGNSNGFISSSVFSNFGTRAGLDFNFLYPESNFETGFVSNAYFSRGFFQPHLWFAGYEYSARSRINTAIAEFSANNAEPRFQIYILTFEGAYYLHIGNSFSLNTGFSLPLSLTQGYNTNEAYVAPTFFLDLNFNFLNIINLIGIQFTFYYANNYLNTSEWDFADPVNGLSEILQDIFSGPNTMLETKMETTILQEYLIDVGIMLSPDYDESELQYTQNGSAVKTRLLPFVRFTYKFK